MKPIESKKWIPHQPPAKGVNVIPGRRPSMDTAGTSPTKARPSAMMDAMAGRRTSTSSTGSSGSAMGTSPGAK